jgi:hypothetical protein
MEHNPYQAPAAVVSDAVDSAGIPFYVVSPRKFLWLQFGSCGLYAVYWFYRHWKAQNTQPNRDYWPIPRAIFAIFFTHALFGEIRHVIDRRGYQSDFSSGFWTAVYLTSVIASMVVGQFARFGVPPAVPIVIGILLILPTGWALYQAQRAANVACADPDGSANADITAANVVWIAIGAMLWLINLVMAYVALTGGMPAPG